MQGKTGLLWRAGEVEVREDAKELVLSKIFSWCAWPVSCVNQLCACLFARAARLLWDRF